MSQTCSCTYLCALNVAQHALLLVYSAASSQGFYKLWSFTCQDSGMIMKNAVAGCSVWVQSEAHLSRAVERAAVDAGAVRSSYRALAQATVHASKVNHNDLACTAWLFGIIKASASHISQKKMAADAAGWPLQISVSKTVLSTCDCLTCT